MELLFKKIDDRAKLPTRGHSWDAGLDLYSIENRVIFYQHATGIRTGLELAIPQGYFGLLTIRSSLGKKGIQLANAPGIIDSGYRGELIVMLMALNENLNYSRILEGQKVAQLIVLPLPTIHPVFVDELPPSDGRGKGGFGSTGGF
jgi:dUTP pyrophosphatase